jgi:hypothetical protein
MRRIGREGLALHGSLVRDRGYASRVPRLSKGEINRLGERIRSKGGLVDEADRELLERVLTEHMEILPRAREIIVDGLHPRPVDPTPRLKSDKTLVEKLLNEPGMELSRVQDISGMRIVEDLTWDQQDGLAAEIARLFERARLVDRRADPRSGYRTLHVVVSLDGRFIEVQIRTPLQDAWAQVFERLGDVWGRQIRYGGAPNPPKATDTGTMSYRQGMVDMLLKFSDLIADHEQAVAELVQLEFRLDELPEPETDDDRDEVEDARQDLQEAKERREATGRELAKLLEDIRRTIE